MISLNPQPVDTERPRNIALVAMLIAAFSLLAAVYGVYVLGGVLPFNSGAWVVGEEVAERGWLAYLLSALVHFVAAAGLWKQWRWAKWLAVVLLASGLVPAVPGISAAVVEVRIAGIFLWGTLIVLRSASLYMLLAQPED